MALASLTELKRRLDKTGSGEDTVLGDVLAAAQADVERYCRRKLSHGGTITEYFDGGGTDLYLEAWPVTELTSVVIDDGDYSFATAETADEDFRLSASRGRIARLPIDARWPRGVEHIRVIYRGGYLGPDDAPVAGVSVAPEHIQEAVLLQAIHRWNRRKDPEATTHNLQQAGVTTWQQQVGILQQVETLLTGERRLF